MRTLSKLKLITEKAMGQTVNAYLKSLVRENFMQGSVRVLMVVKFNVKQRRLP